MVELAAGWHDGYTFLPVHNKLLLLAFFRFSGTWTLEVFNLIAKVSPKGQMEKQLSIEYTPFFFNFPP